MHLVAMVAWFAGLFYLVRLFVYHTEAFKKEQPEKGILCAQYHVMEDRLFKIICQPAIALVWIFGLAMIVHNGWDWFKEHNWLHVKIALVFGLSIYHEYNKKIIVKLKNNEYIMTPFRFRLYNEVPTLFLVAIVLLAVYKNLLNFGYTFAGIFAFGIVLFLIAKAYKNKRLKSTHTNDEKIS